MAVAVIGAIVSASAGAAFSAGSAAFLAGSVLTGVGYFALGIGVLVAGALLQGALMGSIDDQNVRSEVPKSTPLPKVRWVIGETQVIGERIARTVDGADFYGVYLYNSRPSVGPFTLQVDDREVEILSDASNDIYDMAKGATVSEDGGLLNNKSIRLWLSLGDQDGPPDSFVSETDVFDANDKFKGYTVLYLKATRRGLEKFPKRWPNAANFKLALHGKWSTFTDPRDDVEKFTATPAIVAHEVIRSPLGFGRPERFVDVDAFKEGADIEETLAEYNGYSGPAMQLAGVFWFESRNADLLAPLTTSAGSVVVPRGARLSYVPAATRQTVGVLAECFGEFHYEKLRTGADVFNAARGRFFDPDVFAPAETPERINADSLLAANNESKSRSLSYGLAANQLQVQWLVELALRSVSYERRISGLFPTSALRFYPGENVVFAAEGADHIHGTYRVKSNVAAIRSSEGGAHTFAKMVLEETSPDIYDQSTFVALPYTPPNGDLDVISDLDAPDLGIPISDKTTVQKISGTTISARAKISWSVSGRDATGLQFGRSYDGGQTWQRIADLDVGESPASGDFYDEGVSIGESYRWRARTLGQKTASVWSETSPDLLIPAPTADLSAPSIAVLISGTDTGDLVLEWVAPGNDEVGAVRLYYQSAISGSSAVKFAARTASAGEVVRASVTLASGVYDFWAVGYTVDGRAGAIGPVLSVTISII